MRKSLNLGGDGDELELIIDVEEIFGIKFTDAELEACRTAGDLNEAVWRHLSGRGGGDNIRCMNAMAFYALRRALTPAGAGRKIRLSDPLDSFAQTPKQLASALQQKTGLKLRLVLGKLGTAGALMILAGIACLLLAIKWHALLIGAAALFLGARFLLKRDSGAYKRGCKTVGDAAVNIAADNFGLLAGRGARFDAKSVWQALCAALSWYGDCPVDEIGPGTLLIHP